MSKGLTTAAGAIFIVEFVLMLVLPPIFIMPIIAIIFGGMPGFEMFIGIFAVMLVLVQMLLYHWTLVFGLLCLRWREFPGENKNALLAFGIIGIIFSCIFIFIGGYIDYVGVVLGIIAGILLIIASATSKDF